MDDRFEETIGSNLDVVEVTSNEDEQIHHYTAILQGKSNEEYTEISNEEINSEIDMIQVISHEDEEIHDLTVEDDDMSSEEHIEIANEENNTETDIIRGSLYGMKRDTLNEMYELYCKHAHALGFSVRKSTSRYSHSEGVISVELAKLYVCSCNGLRKSKDDGSSIGKSRRKNITTFTRTDCQAKMRAKRNDDGVYEVNLHVVEHNHPLTRAEWSHLHRSERKITNEKATTIIDMTSSEMRATESFHYLAHNVGGEEYVGHTLKHHINFVVRWKSKRIEGGDAETVLNMIQDQDSEESDFFYKVKVDNEGRLANIFWRDSMMKEDYEIYGDVMVFDTTYRTNRYNLICAPFVGVNNHWKNTMFGCAFISDEKAETFEWLFNVFKKSMGGKYPVTIFTDQNLAIANAIEKVFPETSHKLCLWHIHQNAVAKFGELKSDNTFKRMFSKCLSGCSNEVKFEYCWKTMITEYKLEDNNWFTRLCSLKHKWCTALNKKFFSAGIRSSQRSESINHAIGFNANQTTSLTDFYGVFKDTVKRWRLAEVKDEFDCSNSWSESTSLIMAGMLSHASEVYTFELFEEFHKEFKRCIALSTTVVGVHDSTILFDVKSFKGDISYKVIYDSTLNLIKCDCMKFEEFGMLCAHSLRILHNSSAQRIPDAYIVKRWKKTAKKEVLNKFKEEGSRTGKRADSIPWRHEMIRTLCNQVLKAGDNEEARTIIEESCKRNSAAIDALISPENVVTLKDSNSSRTVLDPARSTTKGRGKIIKGHFEENKEKKKNNNNNKKVSASTSAQSEEFGSKIPKPILF